MIKKHIKKCVIVLGMHRSGTSAIAGALRIYGVEFGQNLLPGRFDNPKGYFEDKNIVSIHETILRKYGSSWDSVIDIPVEARSEITNKYKNKLKDYVVENFSGQTVFGFKDPRTTKLLFLWEEIFKELSIEPYYVIITRNPREVCGSLSSRNGLDPVLSLVLWVKEYMNNSQQTKGHKRIYIDYEDLLNDPLAILNKIKNRFGLTMGLTKDKKQEVLSFIDKSLNKSGSALKLSRFDKISGSVHTLYQQLINISKQKSGTGSNNFMKAIVDSSKKAISELALSAMGKCQEKLKMPPLSFQVFLDCGKGFSENGSKVIKYETNKAFAFDEEIFLNKDLKNIRIDPSDRVGNITGFKLEIAVDGINKYTFRNNLINSIKIENLVFLPETGSFLSISDDPIMIVPISAPKGSALKIQAELLFEENIENLCFYLRALQGKVYEKNKMIDATIKAKDKEIVQRNEEINAVIKAKDKEIVQRDKIINQKDQEILHRDRVIKQKEESTLSTIKNKNKEIMQRDEIIKQKEISNLSAIKNKDKEIVQRDEIIKQKEGSTVAANNSLSVLQNELIERDKVVEQYQRMIPHKDALINKNAKRIKEIEGSLSYKMATIIGSPARLLHHIFTENMVSLMRSLENWFAYIKVNGSKMFANKFRPNLSRAKTGQLPSRSPAKELGPLPNENTPISVVIPTFNDANSLSMLIPMLKNQKAVKVIEIITVDSGSTDGTREIAAKFGAKVINIPSDKFSHDYARNLGADKATGDYILFMTQDAMPPSNTWLSEMLRGLLKCNVVAVSCIEIPRTDADLYSRISIWEHHRFLGVDGNDRIFSKPKVQDYENLRRNGQLSDIACLISKKIFMKFKFMSSYAEDLDLGIRLIQSGYKAALLCSTAVIHSHNRSPYYYLKRGYVDGTVLSKIFKDFPLPHIDTADITKDIILTYHAIDHIVNNDLRYINTPCHIKMLLDSVIAGLRSSRKYIYPIPSKIPESKYIDDDFKGFLERICARISNKEKHSQDQKGVISAIAHYIGKTTYEYMISNYDLIDDVVIEDFKSSIFKAFAFQVGSRLANSRQKWDDILSPNNESKLLV